MAVLVCDVQRCVGERPVSFARVDTGLGQSTPRHTRTPRAAHAAPTSVIRRSAAPSPRDAALQVLSARIGSLQRWPLHVTRRRPRAGKHDHTSSSILTPEVKTRAVGHDQRRKKCCEAWRHSRTVWSQMDAGAILSPPRPQRRENVETHRRCAVDGAVAEPVAAGAAKPASGGDEDEICAVCWDGDSDESVCAAAFCAA